MTSQQQKQKSVAEIIGGDLLCYQRQIQKAKQNLTFKVLVDLQSLNAGKSAERGQQEQRNQDIQKRKQILLGGYIKAINSLDQQYVEKEMQFMKNSIEQYQEAIPQLESGQIQNREQELLEIQQKLNKVLTSSYQSIKNYIQTLALRVKHERYLDDEREINQYLQKQEQEIEEQRGDIQKIIRNHNDEVRRFAAIAKDVCREKQSEINSLKQNNQLAEKRLKITTQSIEELNSKEKEIYKNISNLSEEILRIKAQSKAKFRQIKALDKKSSQNHAKLSNQNLGSEIIPSRQSLVEPSSMILPELSNEESKPQAKCEIIGQSFKTELLSNKMAILVMVILSLSVYMW